MTKVKGQNIKDSSLITMNYLVKRVEALNKDNKIAKQKLQALDNKITQFEAKWKPELEKIRDNYVNKQELYKTQ